MMFRDAIGHMFRCGRDVFVRNAFEWKVGGRWHYGEARRTAFGLSINHILPEGSGWRSASNASAIPLRRGRKGEGRVGKRLPVDQTARS